MSAHIVEEHSSVLAHWMAGGVRGATLVYLDAHLDLQFIDPARIARLAACPDADALARLESRHCFAPERDACYGIEDFLYPAGQLGIVRRVVWVAPPHVIKGGMAHALRGLLQMEGVTIDDLETFRVLPGGVIEGRLLGVDLAVCTLAQLPQVALETPLLFDVDADYFVAVPEDLLWCEAGEVVTRLRAVAGPDAALTIARSVSSGFMPLQYRFVADHVAALWEARNADAANWQRLRAALGDEDALAALHSATPGCAATAFALALATSPGDEREALLAHAGRADPAYADDIVRRLGEVGARRKRCDVGTLLRLRAELAGTDLAPARAATAWVLLGRLFAAAGRLADALDCHDRSRADGAGHPQLALDLARLYCGAGNVRAALPLLAHAAGDDETRVGAWLTLAECSAPAAARGWATLAAQAAPAWPLPMARLLAVSDENARPELIYVHEKLLQRIEMLGRRLSV